MRAWFYRVPLLFLSCPLLIGCSQPSAGVDWFDYTTGLTLTGSLRVDRDPDDVPFDRDTLADNFEALAFRPEEDPFLTGEPAPGEDEVHLRKWLKPIVYRIVEHPGGDTPFQGKMARYMDHLSRLTGVAIFEGRLRQGRSPANLVVVYGDDEMMQVLADPLQLENPDWSEPRRRLARSISESAAAWRTAPSPCAATIFSVSEVKEGHTFGEIISGFVFIRNEIPEALLDACIEEELAQALGLLNDDDEVRPSIFNDDQEFALLTRHDELLLRILYDPRLRPGMSMDEAMPLVRQIAAGIDGDG